MPLLTAYLESCGIKREPKRLCKKIPDLMETLREKFLNEQDLILGKRSIADTVKFLRDSR